VSYRFRWSHGLVFLGVVLVLLIVPHFVLIALAVVALAAVLALAAAVLAIPYRLVRALRRRRAERRRSTDEGPIQRPSVVARTDRAARQSDVGALAEPTTARRSQ
jgi:hypothetical protein